MPRHLYIERVNQLREAFIPSSADSLAELAIKFVLHNPGVTTAITSMHVPQFADDNIAAVDREPLSDEAFDRIRHYHRWVRNFYETKYF